MGDSGLVYRLASLLEQINNNGLSEKTEVFPYEVEKLEEDEQNLYMQFSAFFGSLKEAYSFANNLSAGKLDSTADKRNWAAMPLKALQSNLLHLTWQTEQVANGNLNQKVHFLGDFSLAFNEMIESLKRKNELEEEIIKNEERLRTITSVLGQGVYVVDNAGCVTFMNPAAEAMLGWNVEELKSRMIHELIHFQYEDGILMENSNNSPLVKHLQKGLAYKSEEDVFTSKNGRIIPVSIVSSPIITKNGLEGHVVAFSDITEQKRYKQSLEYINKILEKQAKTDSLTGISNRSAFSETLLKEISRSERYGDKLSLIIFDIDKFKNVNDTFGHIAGDGVLKKLANIVKENIRLADFFARWGGEEFIVLCPGCSADDASTLAEKLRKVIMESKFDIDLNITCSFGVSEYSVGDSQESFTGRADSALYDAKNGGRNMVCKSS